MKQQGDPQQFASVGQANSPEPDPQGTVSNAVNAGLDKLVGVQASLPNVTGKESEGFVVPGLAGDAFMPIKYKRNERPAPGPDPEGDARIVAKAMALAADPDLVEPEWVNLPEPFLPGFDWNRRRGEAATDAEET